MTTPSPGKAGIHHPIFARRYARLSQEMEQHGVAEHRRRLLAGEADRLPAADGAFDAGIASLVLCSVPDQPRALAELFRVIRPGGELRFFEHVRAGTPGLACLQRLVDPVWPALGGGCHASRDTLAAITAAGFDVDRYERFRFRPCRFSSPTSPHVLGVARRPR